MTRQLALFTLLFSLLLAACTSVTTPAQTGTPATEVEVSPTAVEEESATEEPTEEATAEATEEATEEPTETATPEAEIEAGDTVTETQEAITGTVDAGATVNGTTGMTETSKALTGCLEPNGDTRLISSTAAGYCFLIPAGFERSEFSDAEGFSLGIYGPASTPGHRERAFIKVTDINAADINATDINATDINATGSTTQTLEASVQAVVDEVAAAMPGFTPTQSSLTLGGVPAIRIDNLPGQDVNRKVYALNEGRLYELTFVPFDELRPDAMAEAEELYNMVVESFRFITPTEAASSFMPLLTWEGEIDGACHTLTINPAGEAQVGVCGDEPSAESTFGGDHVEWNAVQEHFGNIDAETPAGKIVFQGQGNAESDLWAQALATWASFTAMEINAGRTSASARTTLAWQLSTEPEHSGLCSQLIVLAYGFAYANQIPCEGSGQATQVASGWLSDTELDTFMGWVNDAARVESELGYLGTEGETPVTPEEITAWAGAVYTRLLQ